jgi:epoxyqueuosine reductase
MPPDENRTPPAFRYAYRTLPVERFKDLKNDMDSLRRKGRLSKNPTFLKYIQNRKFEVPKDFPEARSLIVLAVFTRGMTAGFHWKGTRREIFIPPQYVDDGITWEELEKTVRADILQNSGARLEKATGIHLKLAAVRSGLGRYGRNNLCYVEGMGSWLTLYAFFTDFRFGKESWGPLQLLEACRRCRMCYGLCPTGCITRENFVIDAGRCITLFNEVAGDFPSWIQPRMHNSLMGCLKCQKPCPENVRISAAFGILEDVTEEETRKILENRPDDALLESLRRKLKDFYPSTTKEAFPIFARNLGVLIGGSA